MKDSEALSQLALARPEVSLTFGRENDLRWLAVYTASRHEKCVARHFAERRIESFLPLYRKVHHWKKRSAVGLELPLFPNYIFAHILPPQRGALLAVPGVLAVVGRGREPAPLPDNEIESLRSALERNKFEPHPYLKTGERVRVRSGSMEGLEGILVRRKNELRVVLTLDMIQRSVSVEVDADNVEPARVPRLQPRPSVLPLNRVSSGVHFTNLPAS
ncbi:MAG TPA: UpxY family transcription antiterminator [Terriglobales bacterium]|nr:UpxY family transcription antiterminator [Terriglobales bacterium]